MALTDLDLRDIELEVDEFLLDVYNEFQREFHAPTMATVAALAVRQAPPEVLAQLDPASVQRVKELVDGRAK